MTSRSRTHCREGHDLRVVGVYTTGQCKECNRQQQAEWRALRKKQAAERRENRRKQGLPPTKPLKHMPLEDVEELIELNVQLKEAGLPAWELEDIRKQIEVVKRRSGQ